MKKSLFTITCLALTLLIGCKSTNKTKLIFSNESGTTLAEQITEEKAFSGTKSFKLDSLKEWGPSWSLSLDEIGAKTSSITLNCKLLANPNDTILVVLGGQLPNKEYLFYHAMPVTTGTDGTWNDTNVEFPKLPELKDNVNLAVYFWNQNKKLFYIDNVNLLIE